MIRDSHLWFIVLVDVWKFVGSLCCDFMIQSSNCLVVDKVYPKPSGFWLEEISYSMIV